MIAYPDINHISPSDASLAIRYIAGKINEHLRHDHSVAWFVSGGANIQVACDVQKILISHENSQLTICLIDERYGEVGHNDSNWQQLLDAGFDMTQVHPLSVLVDGLSMEETAQRYDEKIRHLLEKVTFSIGQYGMGGDAHTSGLLPRCSAITSEQLYTSYKGPDYLRITSTPVLIREIDEAVLVVTADDRSWAISQLFSEGPTYEAPVRVLKQAKRLTVFSASTGENI
jgi:6-phosphogluconolactonase/glucosamine-6-phosphate isomerase/deaminase